MGKKNYHGHYTSQKKRKTGFLLVMIFLTAVIAAGVFLIGKFFPRQQEASPAETFATNETAQKETAAFEETLVASEETEPAENLKIYVDAIREFEENYFYSEPMTYTFYDFDEDGQQELLLGSGTAIRIVWKEVKGEAEKIWESANQSYVYLCENGILWDQSIRGNWFTDKNGTVVEFVYYVEETDSWYRKNHEKTPDVPIFKETADEILNSFVRVDLNWQPLENYPADLTVQGNALFENVFLPLSESGTWISSNDVMALLDSNGFDWRLAEGMIDCIAPDEPGCYLSAVLGNNGHSDISELLFCREKQGISCQALVTYWGNGVEYFTRTDFIGRGVREASAEGFREFLYEEDENLELRAFVEEFVRCYSNVDANGLETMLVSSLLPVDPSTIPGHGYDFKIEMLLGLGTAEADYAANGRAKVAAAYASYPTGYHYLNLELVKENDQWKVSSFSMDDTLY